MKDKKVKKLDKQFKQIMNIISGDDFGINEKEIFERAKIITDKYTDEEIVLKGFKNREHFKKYVYFRYIDLSKEHEKNLKDAANKVLTNTP